MNGPDSLTIRSGRRRSESDLVDIIIRDERVAAILPKGEAPATEFEVDAAGNLVTESFVNTHLHLDKVFTLQQRGDTALADYQSGEMGKAMSASETAAAVKDGRRGAVPPRTGRTRTQSPRAAP